MEYGVLLYGVLGPLYEVQSGVSRIPNLPPCFYLPNPSVFPDSSPDPHLLRTEERSEKARSLYDL